MFRAALNGLRVWGVGVLGCRVVSGNMGVFMITHTLFFSWGSLLIYIYIYRYIDIDIDIDIIQSALF